MALDTQYLASMGQNVPDVVGSTEKAYTLADAIDRRQLNQMTLQSAKEEQADLAKIKQIGQRYDLTKPEDRHAMAADVQKQVGGKYAMDFLRTADEADRRSSELTAANIANMQAKHEAMTNAIVPLYQQIQTLTQQGVPPQQIEATLMPAFKQTLQTLQQTTLPNGEKLLNKEDIQQISSMLSGQPGSLLNGINSAMASSRTAQEYFANQRKQQREEIIEKNIKGPDGKTHTYTFNKVTGERLKDLGIAETAEKPQSAAGTGGDKALDIRAAMAEKQIQFPSGMRSKEAQDATITGLIKRHPNDTADQIVERMVSGHLAMKARETEVGGVARREGPIAAAIDALNKKGGLWDQVIETAKPINFGSAIFANNLKLWQAGKVVSDPKIREYLDALAETRAEFASVLARGGQVTDTVRSASEHAFPDSMSLPELEAAVSRSKKVAGAIQSGNYDVIDRLVNGESLANVAKNPTPGANPPPAVPSPAVPPGPGGGTSPAAPQKITTEAEFNALPSGATFIGPDGQKRRKP